MNLTNVFGDGDGIFDDWDTTDAAPDLIPVPKGTYQCHVTKGELRQNAKGTPGYFVEFTILDGDLAGRKVFHTIYITPRSKPYAKRDLQKLGIDSPAKLTAPYPKGV